VSTQKPVWHKQTLPELRHKGKIFTPLFDRTRVGVVFVSNQQLVAYEMDEDAGQLSSRLNPEVSSPFRLRLFVIDASSGTRESTKEWGTALKSSTVQAISDGVLVQTGNVVRLCSDNFIKCKESKIQLEKEEMLFTSVSPTGKTIMLNRADLSTNSSKLDIIDAKGNSLHSWSDSPALYHNYAMSDTDIVAFQAPPPIIAVTKLGSTQWQNLTAVLGRKPRLFCDHNALTFYSDHEFLYGVWSDDTGNLVASSDTGEVILKDPLGKETCVSDRMSVAQQGRFVAISLSAYTVRRGFLTEASRRLKSIQVAVYDMAIKARALTVTLDPLPNNDYDFALSPDGSRLAVLTDREVSVYSVPTLPPTDKRLPSTKNGP
jgi:hypothetical protein